MDFPSLALRLIRTQREATARGAPLEAKDELQRLLSESTFTLATTAELRRAARNVDPNPTHKQREQGNYALGHVRWKGLPIAIEVAKGGYRRGINRNGVEWCQQIPRAHYGYIKRTESAADGDAVDVFLCDGTGPGEHLDSDVVFVVNQVKANGDFDEHKCVLGCASKEAAKEVYLSAYKPGWKGCGSITAMTVPQFKEWLQCGDTSRPVMTLATATAIPQQPKTAPISHGDKSTILLAYLDALIDAEAGTDPHAHELADELHGMLAGQAVPPQDEGPAVDQETVKTLATLPLTVSMITLAAKGTAENPYALPRPSAGENATKKMRGALQSAKTTDGDISFDPHNADHAKAVHDLHNAFQQYNHLDSSTHDQMWGALKHYGRLTGDSEVTHRPIHSDETQHLQKQVARVSKALSEGRHLGQTRKPADYEGAELPLRGELALSKFQDALAKGREGIERSKQVLADADAPTVKQYQPGMQPPSQRTAQPAALQQTAQPMRAPVQSGASASPSGQQGPTEWRRLAPGERSPVSGRIIKSQHAWFDPVRGRLVYADRQHSQSQQGQSTSPAQLPQDATHQRAMTLTNGIMKHVLNPDEAPAPTQEHYNELVSLAPKLHQQARVNIRNQLLGSFGEGAAHKEMLANALREHVKAKIAAMGDQSHDPIVAAKGSALGKDSLQVQRQSGKWESLHGPSPDAVAHAAERVSKAQSPEERESAIADLAHISKAHLEAKAKAPPPPPVTPNTPNMDKVKPNPLGQAEQKPEVAPGQKPPLNQPSEHSTTPQSGATKAQSPSGHATLKHFDKFISQSNTSPEKKKAYAEAMGSVVSKMPRAAHERVIQTIKGATFHNNTKDIAQAAYDDVMKSPNDRDIQKKAFEGTLDSIKSGKMRAGGAYILHSGHLHVDGDYQPEGQQRKATEYSNLTKANEIYAHELGHALDGPGKAISSSKAWRDAWSKDIFFPGAFLGQGDAKLSHYAATSSEEGVAEFARVLYASDVATAKIEKDFPNASAVFKSHGLWPEDRGGDQKAANEIFEKRIPLSDDGSHIDTLKEEPDYEKHKELRPSVVQSAIGEILRNNGDKKTDVQVWIDASRIYDSDQQAQKAFSRADFKDAVVDAFKRRGKQSDTTKAQQAVPGHPTGPAISGTPQEIEHGKAYNVPTSSLNVDPHRFQYKLHMGQGGVGDTLKGVKYNPTFGGILHVWRDPADGKDYVVNGHHRYELADRSKHQNLNVQYLDAKDATEARALGALVNIAEGHGTALDAAKFLRDSGMTPQELKEKHQVSLKGKVAADAAILSKLAGPLFHKLALGQIDEDRALAIGKHLGDDESKQMEFFNFIQKHEQKRGDELPPKTIERLALKAKEAPKSEGGGDSLFGEGADESTFVAQAELENKLRADLVKQVNHFGAIKSDKRAEATAGAGNILNTEQNKEEHRKASEMVYNFDALSNKKGQIAEILKEEGANYARAKNAKQREAVQRTAGIRLRDALLRQSGSAVEAQRGTEGADHSPSVSPGGAAGAVPQAAPDRGPGVDGRGEESAGDGVDYSKLSKEQMKELAKSMPAPESLPEKHDDYFKHVEGQQVVPLNQIRNLRARPEGIENAAKFMEISRRGGPKREPIKVVQEADGTYTVADGNSTFANAKKNGWSNLPVQVVPREWMEAEQRKTVEKEDRKAREKLSHDKLFTPEEMNVGKHAKNQQASKEEIAAVAHDVKRQYDNTLNTGKGLDKVLGATVFDPAKLPPGTTPAQQYQAFVDSLKQPGPIVQLAPIKNLEGRAKEKVEADMGGDWSKLHDVVRGTVGVDSVHEIPDVVAKLKAEMAHRGFKLVKTPKNRFGGKPTPEGYRDINLSFASPNGLVTEVQVNTKPMLLAKETNHHLYEEERGILAKLATEERAATPEEMQRVMELVGHQRNAYTEAWLKSLGVHEEGNDNLVQHARQRMEDEYNNVWAEDLPKVQEPTNDTSSGSQQLPDVSGDARPADGDREPVHPAEAARPANAGVQTVFGPEPSQRSGSDQQSGIRSPDGQPSPVEHPHLNLPGDTPPIFARLVQLADKPEELSKAIGEANQLDLHDATQWAAKNGIATDVIGNPSKYKTLKDKYQAIVEALAHHGRSNEPPANSPSASLLPEDEQLANNLRDAMHASLGDDSTSRKGTRRGSTHQTVPTTSDELLARSGDFDEQLKALPKERARQVYKKAYGKTDAEFEETHNRWQEAKQNQENWKKQREEERQRREEESAKQTAEQNAKALESWNQQQADLEKRRAADAEDQQKRIEEARNAPMARQPHEMTKAEHDEMYGMMGRKYAHKPYVRAALEEGKNVSPEVLKDYPDLAKKYAKSAQAQTAKPDRVPVDQLVQQREEDFANAAASPQQQAAHSLLDQYLQQNPKATPAQLRKVAMNHYYFDDAAQEHFDTADDFAKAVLAEHGQSERRPRKEGSPPIKATPTQLAHSPHHATVDRWLNDAHNEHIAPHAKERIGRALKTTLSRMHSKAADMAMANMAEPATLYNSVAHLTHQYNEDSKKLGQPLITNGNVAGYYNLQPDGKGTLHLDYSKSGDEGDAVWTHAHEFHHAIDGHDHYSGTPEWQAAYNREIRRPKDLPEDQHPLSAYASTHPNEGFAEFGALLVADAAYAKKAFPQSYAFFAKHGLVEGGDGQPASTTGDAGIRAHISDTHPELAKSVSEMSHDDLRELQKHVAELMAAKKPAKEKTALPSGPHIDEHAAAVKEALEESRTSAALPIEKEKAILDRLSALSLPELQAVASKLNIRSAKPTKTEIIATIGRRLSAGRRVMEQVAH